MLVFFVFVFSNSFLAARSMAAGSKSRRERRDLALLLTSALVRGAALASSWVLLAETLRPFNLISSLFVLLLLRLFVDAGADGWGETGRVSVNCEGGTNELLLVSLLERLGRAVLVLPRVRSGCASALG